jgi:predicted nucleic acid-binding protein
MSVDKVTYLDSSAIVKLVVNEPESRAQRQYHRRPRPFVSSSLARAEVTRAVLPQGERALRQTQQVLSSIDLLRISDRVLTAAGTELPADIRTLDAIHVATASMLGDSLGPFICYDDRLIEAVRARGWTTHAPT